MNGKFRVWCKNKKEWEKNDVALLQNGSLFDLDNKVFLKKENHVLLFSINHVDCEDNELYQGDILLLSSMESWKNGDGEIGIVGWYDEEIRWDLNFYSIYGGEGHLAEWQPIKKYIEKNKGIKVGSVFEIPDFLSDWKFDNEY